MNVGFPTIIGLGKTFISLSEGWCWELMSLLASLFGPVSLAAQAILGQSVVPIMFASFIQFPLYLRDHFWVLLANTICAGRRGRGAGWQPRRRGETYAGATE